MATLDVIRRLTLRAKAEGFDEAERSVKSLGESYETSARRQLSVDKSLQSLERRFITGARAQQDFEKVQRQVNAVIEQNPTLQSRANAVLAEAHRNLLNAGQSGGLLAKQFSVLNSEARGLAASLGPVGALLLSMGPAGLAAGAALGVAAIGMKKLMDESLALSDRAGKLIDLSDTVGLTTRQLQALEIAGQGVGFSLEDISTSTTKFAQKLAEIREGSGSAAKALHEISPALLIQVQSAKSVAEAYDIINKTLVRMDDVTKKVALSRELFGKGGARQGLLAGALADAGGIDKFADRLNQLDIVSLKTLKTMDDLGDAFTLSMRLARQGIDLVFTPAVLAQMKEFSDRILEISRTIQTLPKDMQFGAALREIIDPRLIEFVSQLTLAISELIQMLSALSKINLRTLISEGFSGIQSAASEAMAAGKRVNEALSNMRTTLSTPSLAGDPGGLQGTVKGTKSLGDAAVETAPKLGGVAKGLVDTGKAAKDAKLAFDLYVEGQVAVGAITEENAHILRRLGVVAKEEIPGALGSAEAAQIRFINRSREIRSSVSQMAEQFGSVLSDSLLDLSDGSKTAGQAFEEMSRTIIRSIEQMIIQIAIVQPLMKALKDSLTGPVSSFFNPPTAASSTSVAHSGGLVGSTHFQTRYVPTPDARLVPRLHNGLRSDEMFAILQKGERVTPKGGGGGAPVVVNVQNEVINNHSGAQVSQRTEDNGQGGRKNVIVIDELNASAASRPGSKTNRAIRNAGNTFVRT